MPTSGEMPADNISVRVRRLGVGDTSVRGEVAVRHTELHASFESFLAEFSATFAVVAPDDIERTIGRWLDQLAQQLGAERCTVAEFSVPDRQPGFLLQWLVGKQPAPFISPEDAWIRDELASGRSILISTLDELPAEAASTRQQLEEMGVRSGLWVPIMAEGSAVGGIGLTVMSYEQDWPALVIRRCQIVADTIGNALLRRRRAREIEERSKFEALITDFSIRFMNIDADIDAVIDEVLGELGEFLRTDRVAYLEVDARKQSLIPTRHWFAEGIEQDRSVQYVDVSAQFPWLTPKVIRNESVKIGAMDQFPDEATNERQYCENLGIQAFTMIPATLGGKVVAALALDNFNSPQIWTDVIVQRLRIVTGMIASALDRARRQREIESLKKQLQQENLYLREEAKLTHSYGEIIGDSASLRTALTKVEQVATTDSTVLILGETGTGKELLARAIHYLSSRKDKVMIKVNCATLPSSLVEAELFGREKGAYTGALTRELGRFEIADGSTIFLDEIGELSLELQAKLLRVLQDGEFERLGSSKTRKVDVRVLAATNRNLTEEIENKEFREDLFYRLNVFPIVVPPLRDRVEDIPQLVWAFVQEFSAVMGKTIESIPVTAMDSLREYRWPGNVRELRNIIERAMIVSTGPTLEIDLPTMPVASMAGSSKQLVDVERAHIKAVVEATGWRIRGAGGAAEILGLKATTLEARMKKLGLQRSSTR